MVGRGCPITLSKLINFRINWSIWLPWSEKKISLMQRKRERASAIRRARPLFSHFAFPNHTFSTYCIRLVQKVRPIDLRCPTAQLTNGEFEVRNCVNTLIFRINSISDERGRCCGKNSNRIYIFRIRRPSNFLCAQTLFGVQVHFSCHLQKWNTNFLRWNWTITSGTLSFPLYLLCRIIIFFSYSITWKRKCPYTFLLPRLFQIRQSESIELWPVEEILLTIC